MRILKSIMNETQIRLLILNDSFNHFIKSVIELKYIAVIKATIL